MINKMSRKYHENRDFQGMITYDSLIEAATRISDAIYNGTHGSQVKEADPKEDSREQKSSVNVLSDVKACILGQPVPSYLSISGIVELFWRFDQRKNGKSLNLEPMV